MNNKTYIYQRISTDSQKEIENSLAEEALLLEEIVNKRGFNEVEFEQKRSTLLLKLRHLCEKAELRLYWRKAKNRSKQQS